MKKYRFKWVILSVVCLLLSSTQGYSGEEDLRKWLKGKPILLVGGFTGKEFLQYCFQYMKDFSSEAEAFCMKPKSVFPSSFRGVEETLEPIYTAIRDLHSLADLDEDGIRKPILALGHSMGAARLWATLLNYPDLFNDKIVDHGISVQGCFGGSFIMGDSLPWHSKYWNLPFLRGQWGGRGLHAMKTSPDGSNSVHELLAKIIFEKHNLREESGRVFLMNLHQRLHYVETEVPKEKLSLLSWAAQKISFRSTNQPNDGMLLVEHQHVNEKAMLKRVITQHGLDSLEDSSYLKLGTPLFDKKIEADHVELTTHYKDLIKIGPETEFSPEKRGEFFSDVLRTLFRKRGVPAPIVE